MLTMLRKAVDGIKAYHARKAVERDAARRQARLDKVGRQLAELRRFVDLLDDDGRRGLSQFDTVAAESLEAAEAFLATPAIANTILVGQSLGAVDAFARDLAGDVTLSFSVNEFGKVFGFSPMSEASRFLQSGNLQVEHGLAAPKRSGAGNPNLITSLASTYHESAINGTAGSMTFQRGSSTLSLAEKQGLATLKALNAQKLMSDKDFKGGLYSLIYNGGNCDDKFSSGGLAVSLSQDQVIGRTIAHRMVAQRAPAVERTLRYAAQERSKLDPRLVSAIEAHLGPLSQ